jgi:hypothetical protein
VEDEQLEEAPHHPVDYAGRPANTGVEAPIAICDHLEEFGGNVAPQAWSRGHALWRAEDYDFDDLHGQHSHGRQR